MIVSYKFRLYPTPEQETLIQKTFGCTRYVFNYYLAKRKELYEASKETLNYNACSKDMTALKQALPWLQEVDSRALQNALRDLDTAYKNFFRRVKQGEKPGYPRFKSKHNHCKSYRTANSDKNAPTIKVFHKSVQLPKLGYVECRISKAVRGRVLSATVSQVPSGKYFVSLCCTDVELPAIPKTGNMAGVVFGIEDFLATTSDGHFFENPKYLDKSQKKIAKLSRQLSRKQKGSKNRDKARIKLARAHEKIANQRNDAMQKLTTQLIRDYDVLCIERLSVKDMLKEQKYARSISDASLSKLRRQLAYKADWYGKELVAVDNPIGSLKCIHCGALIQAAHGQACQNCGMGNARSVSIAQNILSEGIQTLAQ